MKSQVVLTTSQNNSKKNLENFIHVWDLDSGNILRSFRSSSSSSSGCLGSCSVHGVAVGSSCVVQCESSSPKVQLFLWNKDKAATVSTVAEKLSSLELSGDGIYLFGGSFSGNLYCWQMTTGKLLKVWEGHRNSRINKLKLSGQMSLSFLLSAAEDSLIKIWSVPNLLSKERNSANTTNNKTNRKEEGKIEEGSFAGHTLPVTDVTVGVASSAGLLYAYSVSLDRSCRMWEVETGKEQGSQQFPVALTKVLTSRLETYVVLGALDGSLFFVPIVFFRGYNKAAEMKLFQTQMLHTKRITGLAESLEGRRVISTSEDGRVLIWDLSNFSTTASSSSSSSSSAHSSAPSANNKNTAVVPLKQLMPHSLLPSLPSSTPKPETAGRGTGGGSGGGGGGGGFAVTNVVILPTPAALLGSLAADDDLDADDLDDDNTTTTSKKKSRGGRGGGGGGGRRISKRDKELLESSLRRAVVLRKFIDQDGAEEEAQNTSLPPSLPPSSTLALTSQSATEKGSGESLGVSCWPPTAFSFERQCSDPRSSSPSTLTTTTPMSSTMFPALPPFCCPRPEEYTSFLSVLLEEQHNGMEDEEDEEDDEEEDEEERKGEGEGEATEDKEGKRTNVQRNKKEKKKFLGDAAVLRTLTGSVFQFCADKSFFPSLKDQE